MSEGRSLGERLADRVAGPPPAAPVTDPCAWIEQRFGVSLYSAQRRIVGAIHENRHTAARAAHSTGKSKVAGLIAGYWIASHPTGSAFVFTTAPRNAQIRGILWREIGRAHRAGNLPGRITMGQQPEWWIGDELVATGRKPADLADPEEAATAMQGIHSEHLLCILDEAAGLAPWVWDAVDSLASNQGARVLALGNPTIRDSRFFEVCQPGSGWHRIKIAAFDSPNLSGEQVPESVACNLVSAEWVAERERRWGVDSALYRARVLAEFPVADTDSLIDPAWVEAAQARELPAEADPRLGCDIARSEEGDRTVVAENRGGRIRIVHSARTRDTTESVGAIARLLLEAGPGASATVDEIGVGGPVLDRLVEQGHAASGFNGAARAADPGRYKNARAEQYWRLRELLRLGELDLPDDDDLAAELLRISWALDSAGRIVIGAKSEMPHSPDLADAVALSVSQPVGALPVAFRGEREVLDIDRSLRAISADDGGDLMEKAW